MSNWQTDPLLALNTLSGASDHHLAQPNDNSQLSTSSFSPTDAFHQLESLHAGVPIDSMPLSLYRWDNQDDIFGFGNLDQLSLPSSSCTSVPLSALNDMHLTPPSEEGGILEEDEDHPRVQDDTDNDLLTDEDADWYKNIEIRAWKSKVLRDLSQYWYGCQEKRAREEAGYHIKHKMNMKEFKRVLESFDDERILQKLTRKIKLKYGNQFMPTNCDLGDLSNNVTSYKAPINSAGHVIAPEWYQKMKRKHKQIVIERMSQIWYGNSFNQTDRDLARYHIARYFTVKDFLYVLQIKGEVENDPNIAAIAKRTGGKRGRMNFNKKIELDLIISRSDPTWYKEMVSYADKKYVITRMSFLYFGDFEDTLCRAKARDYIKRGFSYEDFLTALNPDTDYETMANLAARTKPDPIEEERTIAIRNMKKEIWTSGIIQKRRVDRYVQKAIEREGYADKSVEELKAHVMNKWMEYEDKQRQKSGQLADRSS